MYTACAYGGEHENAPASERGRGLHGGAKFALQRVQARYRIVTRAPSHLLAPQLSNATEQDSSLLHAGSVELAPIATAQQGN